MWPFSGRGALRRYLTGRARPALSAAYCDLRLAMSCVLAALRRSARGRARAGTRFHLRANPAWLAERHGLGRVLARVLRTRWAWVVVAALATVIVVARLLWDIDAGTLTTALGAPTPGDAASVTTGIRDLCIALLSAQTALVALVYPIVVALVSVLLGGRATSGARLLVFVRQTGAIETGASALLLCGATAISAAAVTSIPLWAGCTLVVTCLAWFLVNLCGIGIFLSATVAYLTPSGRQALRRGYVADSAWPRKLEDILTRENAEALAAGWPAAPEDDTARAVVVLGYPVSALEMRGVLQVAPGEGQFVVHDVRTAVLDRVVRGWLDRQEAMLGGDKLPDGTRRCELVLPLLPGMTFLGSANLARWSEGAGLTWLEGWLLHRSFRVRPVRSDRPLRLPGPDTVLADAVGEATVALATFGPEEFRARLDEVADLHAYLLRLAATTDDIGSFATRPSRQTLTAVCEEWLDAYPDLLRQIAAQGPAQPELLRAAAYLPVRIAARAGREVPLEVLRPTDRLLPLLAGELSRPGGPATDPAREKAWREVVGAWEGLRSNRWRESRNEDENATWAKLSGVWPFLEWHLLSTARMVLSAADANDELGVRWATDVLLRWPGGLRLNGDLRGEWAIQRSAAFPGLLREADWGAVLRALPISAPGTDVTCTVVWRVLSRIAWSRTVLATVEVAAEWATARGPGAAAIAAGLLLRHEFHDTSSHYNGPSGPFRDLRTTLSTIIEMERDRAETEELASALAKVAQASMVSMRVYSWAGPEVDRAHAHALLLTAVAFQVPAYAPPELPTNLLTADELQGDEWAMSHLTNVLREIKEFDAGGLMLGALTVGELGNGAQAGNGAKAAATRAVEAAMTFLRSRRMQTLRAARVDREVLRLLARDVARNLPDHVAGSSPGHLFTAVRSGAAGLARAVAVCSSGHSRGEFTSPHLVEPTLEPAFLARYLAEHAARLAAQEVWQAAIEAPSPVSDGAAWWLAISDAIGRVGEEPIILVSMVAPPEWLTDWQFGDGTSLPEGMTLTEPTEGGSDDHVVDLKGTSVFAAPIPSGTTLVLSKARLAAVELVPWMDGELVELRLHESDDSDTVTVEAIVSVRTVLAGVPGVRIRHAHAEEPVEKP